MSLPLWCLLIAALMHVISKAPLAVAQTKTEAGYNNHHPRDQQAQLCDWGQRALAAHLNQIESFPLFAAGILVTLAANVESNIINIVGITYLLARVAYLFFYIRDLALLRTAVWITSYFCSLALIASPLWH